MVEEVPEEEACHFESGHRQGFPLVGCGQAAWMSGWVDSEATGCSKSRHDQNSSRPQSEEDWASSLVKSHAGPVSWQATLKVMVIENGPSLVVLFSGMRVLGPRLDRKKGASLHVGTMVGIFNNKAEITVLILLDKETNIRLSPHLQWSIARLLPVF